MNRKIALSSLSIMGALLIMGGVTFAAFSGTDKVEANTFAAGELVLDARVNGNSTAPAFTVNNATPGQSYVQPINLVNTGSIGSNSTVLSLIEFSSAPDPDLADVLLLELWDDVNNDGILETETDIKRGGPAPLNSPAWSNISLGFGIPAGSSHRIIAKITMDQTASNDYQNAETGAFSFVFTTSQ